MAPRTSFPAVPRQWLPRRPWPREPADQRYENADLFGAICPVRGTGAALALPFADTEATATHLRLDTISANVAAGAHDALTFGRAGWHTPPDLAIPPKITPIWLPSRAPELNPVGNVWQYVRGNSLSDRIFQSSGRIIDAAREAWSSLIAKSDSEPGSGTRDWAHISVGPKVTVGIWPKRLING